MPVSTTMEQCSPGSAIFPSFPRYVWVECVYVYQFQFRKFHHTRMCAVWPIIIKVNFARANNHKVELYYTFVIVSVWLAMLAVPFVLPTTLVHSKLLDCFEPSTTSSGLCCCERFHKMRTTQYDIRIKMVSKIPKNIGDSCIAPLSTAANYEWLKIIRIGLGIYIWIRAHSKYIQWCSPDYYYHKLWKAATY